MHMLAGTTKGNVLTSLVTAFKDVIYAHPVSNAALREQVDNVKIIVHCSEVVRKKRQMGVAHEEPVEPHVCAPAKCITLKAESRTLLVEFNLDTIDSSAGKSCPFAEWATQPSRMAAHAPNGVLSRAIAGGAAEKYNEPAYSSPLSYRPAPARRDAPQGHTTRSPAARQQRHA